MDAQRKKNERETLEYKLWKFWTFLLAFDTLYHRGLQEDLFQNNYHKCLLKTCHFMTHIYHKIISTFQKEYEQLRMYEHNLKVFTKAGGP